MVVNADLRLKHRVLLLNNVLGRDVGIFMLLNQQRTVLEWTAAAQHKQSEPVVWRVGQPQTEEASTPELEDAGLAPRLLNKQGCPPGR